MYAKTIVCGELTVLNNPATSQTAAGVIQSYLAEQTPAKSFMSLVADEAGGAFRKAQMCSISQDINLRPIGVMLDSGDQSPEANISIATSGVYQVRCVMPSDGVSTIRAGHVLFPSSTRGCVTALGTATQGQFDFPVGVAMDNYPLQGGAEGLVYVKIL
jgi:hypothetical protein